MAENSKDIRYLNRDFDSFKKNLIDFAKTYFPNTFSDFNESDPGMMFIEMASYVGDALSFYIDDQHKESFITYAEDKKNIILHAQAVGYIPKVTKAAYVDLAVYQKVPSVGSGTNIRPDFRFALLVREGMSVRSNSNADVSFRTLDDVDFSVSSSSDPTEVSVLERDPSTQQPIFYSLKKKVRAISATEKTKQYTITDLVRYRKLVLPDTNVIGIETITDSDGNRWYEVPFLAKDTVIDEIRNDSNHSDRFGSEEETPYLLALKRVSRRFIRRINQNSETEIIFGAGVSSKPDEVIIPNPRNLYHADISVNTAIDPSNFVYTSTYGLAPSNTTLTVKYLVGGGVQSNVLPGDLTDKINKISIAVDEEQFSNAEQGMLNIVKQSVVANNEEAASGGGSGETIEEIRRNAIAYTAAQDRAVTKPDYIVRAYSMPAKFGSVAKAYITRNDYVGFLTDNRSSTGLADRRLNPLAMNLYCLGYNSSGKLTTLNVATKQNLKTYINDFRILTDGINIRDAYIVNIGVDFEIIVYKNFNKKEVLLDAIQVVKDYFDISNWQINQPIIISDLMLKIANTDGIQSVSNVHIYGKNDAFLGYSSVVYDIDAATKNGVIYPSMDPCIFEVKYPDSDIRGNAK